MSAKHTSGPWRYNNLTDIYDSNGATICELYRGSELNERCKANARLIAAAPEMLDALQVIMTIATCPNHPNAFNAIRHIAATEIENAITKDKA